MVDDNAITLLTPEKIHHDMEPMLATGSTYIEALLEYAKQRDLDVELVGAIAKKSPIILAKLKEEAASRRLLKRDEHESVQLCF